MEIVSSDGILSMPSLEIFLFNNQGSTLGGIKMNNKDLVAKAVYDAVKDDLTLEQVEQLLENPKSAEHGDVAFPAFSLAKVYRKAPQQIAADLAEKNRFCQL